LLGYPKSSENLCHLSRLRVYSPVLGWGSFERRHFAFLSLVLANRAGDVEWRDIKSFIYANVFSLLEGKHCGGDYCEICDVYEEDAVSNQIVSQWFVRFHNDFELEDVPQSGRFSMTLEDHLKQAVDEMWTTSHKILMFPSTSCIF